MNSVNVEAEVADLQEDHVLALVCMDKARLDNNAAHVFDRLFSCFVDKGILLFLGLKGENGNVGYLALIVVLEILHQLALLLEELDSETVISLYKQFVCLVKNLVVNLLGKGYRGQNIDNSFKECVSALKV